MINNKCLKPKQRRPYCGYTFHCFKPNVSLLLQGINHLLEIILKAHGLNVLGLHFRRQQTMYPQNLSLL